MSDPERFYDDYGEAEWDRLATGIDGRLEYEFTRAELERALPDPPDDAGDTDDAGDADDPGNSDGRRVLDAGGGAGRYAVWLADRGYDVTLLDRSRGQLSVAGRKTAERGVRVDRVRGDVAAIPVETDAVDAALCLGGPISHLLAAEDRRRAAAHLRRVTAPGGAVCVSVLGLLGFVRLHLATATHLRALPDLVEDGDYDRALLDRHGYDGGFADCHLFRRAELVDLLEGAGLTVRRVVGLKGPGSVYHDDAIAERVESLPTADREAAVETVDRLRTDPVVADGSVHVLAVCRA